MTQTERAIMYVQDTTGWTLKQTAILNETTGNWVALATTVHKKLRGLAETTHIVIGEFQSYVQLDLDQRPAFMQWLQEITP